MPTIKVGDKIKFAEEKQRYTVQACNERYLICTKPFNPKKTYLYTMVDLKEDIRGTDGYIFQILDYNTKKDAGEYLKELISGHHEISHRHRIKLNIERIDYANDKV